MAAIRTARPGRSCPTSTPRGCCPLFAPWALLPWDVAWFVWRGGTILRLCSGRSTGRTAGGRWQTAVLVALLGFPFGANLDTGNINLLLTLLLWGAQFSGPLMAGVLWAVASWMKWVPVVFLFVLAPRARLCGLAFLAVSILLSLATLPGTIAQLEALVRLRPAAGPARLHRLPVGARARALATNRSVRLAPAGLVAGPPARPGGRSADRVTRRVRNWLGLAPRIARRAGSGPPGAPIRVTALAGTAAPVGSRLTADPGRTTTATAAPVDQAGTAAAVDQAGTAAPVESRLTADPGRTTRRSDAPIAARSKSDRSIE